MAIIEIEGNTKEVADGEAIKEAGRDLGILFSCEQGLCSTCKVVVHEGMEYLGEKNDFEKELCLENERLICQCKISGGKVKMEQR